MVDGLGARGSEGLTSTRARAWLGWAYARPKRRLMRLKDKIALVTGAASGFGAEIARRFVQEGARVAVVDLNGAGAETVAAELNGARAGAAWAAQADVAATADVAAMIDGAEKALGPLDILVNNAGYSHANQPMLDVDEAEFDRIYAVNVKALFLATKQIAPRFQTRGGGVMLSIASTAGVRPRPGLTWYNGSKGAAITLTRSMAVELAPANIRVNAINPVMGETGMLETFMGAADTPENRARFISTIPLGRLSTPADIASASVFLCSDEAAFITGVALEVDGGRCV